MFKRVVSHKGFWFSVVVLALVFVLLFTVIKWAIEGFDMQYFREQDPITFFGGLTAAGLIYGFFVSFGKFRARLKKSDQSS